MNYAILVLFFLHKGVKRAIAQSARKLLHVYKIQRVGKFACAQIPEGGNLPGTQTRGGDAKHCRDKRNLHAVYFSELIVHIIWGKRTPIHREYKIPAPGLRGVGRCKRRHIIHRKGAIRPNSSWQCVPLRIVPAAQASRQDHRLSRQRPSRITEVHRHKRIKMLIQRSIGHAQLPGILIMHIADIGPYYSSPRIFPQCLGKHFRLLSISILSHGEPRIPSAYQDSYHCAEKSMGLLHRRAYGAQHNHYTCHYHKVAEPVGPPLLQCRKPYGHTRHSTHGQHTTCAYAFSYPGP